jgi:hypothetical protein
MLEIVIGVMILAAAFIPLFNLFSSNARRQEQVTKYGYAHYVGRRVLEKAAAIVKKSGNFNDIEQPDAKGVVENGGHATSFL